MAYVAMRHKHTFTPYIRDLLAASIHCDQFLQPCAFAYEYAAPGVVGARNFGWGTDHAQRAYVGVCADVNIRVDYGGWVDICGWVYHASSSRIFWE